MAFLEDLECSKIASAMLVLEFGLFLDRVDLGEEVQEVLGDPGGELLALLSGYFGF